MSKKYRYEPCSERDIPAGVRFDVPRHLQGQMVEIAYGGFDRAGHEAGDPYKRVTDRGLGGGTTYYRLVRDSKDKED